MTDHDVYKYILLEVILKSYISSKTMPELTTCPCCFARLGELFYLMRVEKMSLKDIAKTRTLEGYGKLCCIPHLTNSRPTLYLNEQKLKSK